MKIGQRIRQLRHERGLSQQEVADELNSYQHIICRWERGKVKPQKKSIERICAALGVSLSEFVEGVDIRDIWRSADLENSKGGIHDENG